MRAPNLGLLLSLASASLPAAMQNYASVTPLYASVTPLYASTSVAQSPVNGSYVTPPTLPQPMGQVIPPNSGVAPPMNTPAPAAVTATGPTPSPQSRYLAPPARAPNPMAPPQPSQAPATPPLISSQARDAAPASNAVAAPLPPDPWRYTQALLEAIRTRERARALAPEKALALRAEVKGLMDANGLHHASDGRKISRAKRRILFRELQNTQKEMNQATR